MAGCRVTSCRLRASPLAAMSFEKTWQVRSRKSHFRNREKLRARPITSNRRALILKALSIACAPRRRVRAVIASRYLA
jgi:hypothetical protein